MSAGEEFFSDSMAYDRGMGRLSRVAGAAFLDWLSRPGGLRWLDVGCGTGAFTELLLDRCAPAAVSAIDPSAGQIAVAKTRPGAGRIDYREADAVALPFADDTFDVAVMALVVQYLPDPARAMAEIVRVVRPEGTVAAYVWPGPKDGHPMQPRNEAFEAIGMTRTARPGDRIRTLAGIVELFTAAGLDAVADCAIDIRLDFADFDDYWSSQAADIAADMTAADMDRFRAALLERLLPDAAGRISYGARANAVRGRVPT